jgi:hypothetical protein
MKVRAALIESSLEYIFGAWGYLVNDENEIESQKRFDDPRYM